MKTLIGIAMLCIASAAFAGRIEISPNPISSPARAPEVCVSKFKPNSFVNVELPNISYGFIVKDRGRYCYQSDMILELQAGNYDVTSMVCHFEAGSIPSDCKVGPNMTLVVE